MRKLLAILIFVSFTSFAQEAIFNLNKQNYHLLNYAYFSESQADFSLDNSFEFYNDDRVFNNSVLNINVDFLENFNTGLEASYEYQNGINNIRSLDAIFGYNFHSDSTIGLSFAVNLGVLSVNTYKGGVYTKYSFSEIDTSNTTLYAQRPNVGLSFVANYGVHSLGLSVNHINQPSIPDGNDGRIPVKYSAYIRSSIIKSKLIGSLVYQYQDKYFYDKMDLDYYFNMLSYLGVNLEYYFNEKWNVGLSNKFLSNKNNIVSAQLGFGTGSFYFNYSLSAMSESQSDKTAIFNQLGIYFNFPSDPPRIYRLMGCPSF